MAEWHFSKQEFGPWAKAETDRLTNIMEWLDAGVVPERRAVGDEMEDVKLNPNAIESQLEMSVLQSLRLM